MSYQWEFGDGTSLVSQTNGSGSSGAEASATHTYTSKGTYTVGVSVEWAGSYTFSGHGISDTVALGPVAQPESTVTYRVQEVRSLITGG